MPDAQLRVEGALHERLHKVDSGARECVTYLTSALAQFTHQRRDLRAAVGVCDIGRVAENGRGGLEGVSSGHVRVRKGVARSGSSEGAHHGGG